MIVQSWLKRKHQWEYDFAIKGWALLPLPEIHQCINLRMVIEQVIKFHVPPFPNPKVSSNLLKLFLTPFVKNSTVVQEN